MARKVLVAYDNFDGGDWGTAGPEKAAKNQFRGENVLVYKDGQIGPRPGTVDVAIDNVHALIAPTIKPVAMGRRAGTTTFWYAYVSGAFMNVDSFDAAFTLLPGPPTPVGPPVPTAHPDTKWCQSYDRADGSFSYFASRDQIWRITWGGPAFAKIGGSPASNHGFVHYGDRYVSGFDNTLRYSSPGSAATWPAVNAITVGESTITALYVVRGSLVIVNDDYSVWVMTGVPGVNEYLREVIPRYEGHVDKFDFSSGDVERGARAWLATPGLQSPANVIPAIFGGSAITKEWDEHEVDAFRNADGVANDTWDRPERTRALTTVLHQADDVLLLGAASDTNHEGDENPNGLVRHNGVWTRHRFLWPHHGHAHLALHLGDGRVVVAADNDVGGATPTWAAVYVQAVWDKVPVARSDLYQLLRIGDNSDVPVDAFFDLSEFWLPDGQQMIVRDIEIDATVVDVANEANTLVSSVNSGLDLNVRYVGVDPSIAATTGVVDQLSGVMTISVSPTAIASTIDPEYPNYAASQHRTFRLSPPALSARGFQLQIRNLVGMSIRRITVFGETDPPR